SPSQTAYRPLTRSALGYLVADSGASTTCGRERKQPGGRIALALPPTMLASSPSTSERSSWLTSPSSIARNAAAALRAARVEDAYTTCPVHEPLIETEECTSDDWLWSPVGTSGLTPSGSRYDTQTWSTTSARAAPLTPPPTLMSSPRSVPGPAGPAFRSSRPR